MCQGELLDQTGTQYVSPDCPSHTRNPVLTQVAAKRYLEDLLKVPIRDKTQIGTHTCLIMGILAVVVYFLRVIARLPVLGGVWGMDDWLMTLSMVMQYFACLT